MYITVLDTYMQDIRVFANVKCDDTQDWLYNNDPDYDTSTCHYMVSDVKPTYREVNNGTHPQATGKAE